MSSLVLFPTQPEGRTVAQQEDEMRALMQRLREMRSSRKRELRRLRSEEADLCHTLEEPEFAFGNEGSLPSQEELNELRERLHALKHEKALRTYKFRALQRERVAQLHLVGAVPDTQFEREIVDSPETFIISLRNLEKAAAYLQKLKELANARREEITALMKELNIFWDRLDVPEEQQLGHPTGLAAEVIDTRQRRHRGILLRHRSFVPSQEELHELRECLHTLKQKKLKELANARREEITALMKELNIFWDRLDVPEEQQLGHPTGLAAEVIDTRQRRHRGILLRHRSFVPSQEELHELRERLHTLKQKKVCIQY
ncbi:protein regulator of cytokinesis 1 [Dermacentor silvarum]|uniref:protein regulator of cytokinesis 1 n=1 Tax=Dermacentor silvarum TaxID=543639 RepID=UPI0018999956|nr:protein regulator of cytokinesis 1 [Dermacentor silvarum]